MAAEPYGIDLYWLPLGAGGHSVRVNGRVYEALVAMFQRRKRYDLYHSALEVTTPKARFVIEMAPSPDRNGARRGVVAEGPVGCRLARHLRLFRYEVRRWRDGTIPDVAEAIDSPQHLSDDAVLTRHVLELVPQVPTLVWGRDESGAHDMWNSNSLTSWLLARAGVDVRTVQPPRGGRAPGWQAGLTVASQAQEQLRGESAPSALIRDRAQGRSEPKFATRKSRHEPRGFRRRRAPTTARIARRS
jgi:hypothetical protein